MGQPPAAERGGKQQNDRRERRDQPQLEGGRAQSNGVDRKKTVGRCEGQPEPCDVLNQIPVIGAFVRQRTVHRYAEAHGLNNILREVMTDSAKQKPRLDRKSTRLNSSHVKISYAVFCLKK